MAHRWGAIFDVPPAWLLTVASVESTHNPRKVNAARSAKGGAWGLYQQMLDEVDYKVDRIAKRHRWRSPLIPRTLRLWQGDPSDLLQPDLNAMLAAWQLGRLRRLFGDDIEAVAAAYHQGEGAVKRRRERGLPPVSPAQPRGLDFTRKIVSRLPHYEILSRGESPIATPNQL